MCDGCDHVTRFPLVVVADPQKPGCCEVWFRGVIEKRYIKEIRFTPTEVTVILLCFLRRDYTRAPSHDQAADCEALAEQLRTAGVKVEWVCMYGQQRCLDCPPGRAPSPEGDDPHA